MNNFSYLERNYWTRLPPRVIQETYITRSIFLKNLVFTVLALLTVNSWAIELSPVSYTAGDERAGRCVLQVKQIDGPIYSISFQKNRLKATVYTLVVDTSLKEVSSFGYYTDAGATQYIRLGGNTFEKTYISLKEGKVDVKKITRVEADRVAEKGDLFEAKFDNHRFLLRTNAKKGGLYSLLYVRRIKVFGLNTSNSISCLY